MSMYTQLMISKVILCAMAIGLGSQAQGQEAAPLRPADLPAPQPSATAGPNYQVAQRLGNPTRQQEVTASQPGSPVHQAAVQGAPFQLSSVEQQFVNQVLMMWENQSNQITTYSCDFQRWEYDPVFGPSGNTPLIKSQGQLTYAKPDKGSFKITSIHRWVQTDSQQAGTHVLQKNEVGEHWVCDGKAIFEYKHDKKQLVVQPLPQELRGKSIVDGPLPFLFGAEAEKMKARYWIRSPQGNAATIRLEAYPRRQVDAANYHHVEVMLDRKSMLPSAIQVHMPNNRNRSVYIFSKPTINGKMNQLFSAIFKSPRTPIGWTKVVQPQPTGNPQAALPQQETRK